MPLSTFFFIVVGVGTVTGWVFKIIDFIEMRV